MKIKLLRPVKYGGKWYKVGENVDFRKEEAEKLIKMGAAEEIKKKEEENNGNKD